MAEIILPPDNYDEGVFRSLSTPTKSGMTMQIKELSPPPTYPVSKSLKTSDFPPPLTEAQSTIYTPSQPQLHSLAPESHTLHPVLPEGDVYWDVKNHIKCYPIYNHNVDRLAERFRLMKDELDEVLAEKAKADRKAEMEHQARLSAERRLEAAENQLQETQDDLKHAKEEISTKDGQIAHATSLISQLVGKLETTKTSLRDMTRAKEGLDVEVGNIKRELTFYKGRCDKYKQALDIANAGEDAANDRNTRLTKMLFTIEEDRAKIERARDVAVKKVLSNELLIEELENGTALLEKNNKIKELSNEVENLNGIREGLIQEMAHKDNEITELRGEITELKEEVEELTKNLNTAERNFAQSEVDLNKSQTDLAKAREDLSKAQADYTKTEGDLKKAQADLITADENLSETKNELEETKTARNIAQAQVDEWKKVIDTKLSEKNRNKFYPIKIMEELAVAESSGSESEDEISSVTKKPSDEDRAPPEDIQ